MPKKTYTAEFKQQAVDALNNIYTTANFIKIAEARGCVPLTLKSWAKVLGTYTPRATNAKSNKEHVEAVEVKSEPVGITTRDMILLTKEEYTQFGKDRKIIADLIEQEVKLKEDLTNKKEEIELAIKSLEEKYTK